MQLDCSRCQSRIDYTDKRPSFCPYCGQALAGSRPPSQPIVDTEAVTAPPPPTGASTIDPEAATIAPPPSAGPGTADPEMIGGYRLLQPLGGGGMGTVYEAEEIATSRHVALKLISREYAGSKESVERFRQEGRLASAIAHPRCVFVVAADEEGGRPYIVMELMPGSTLQDLVQGKGPLPIADAVKKIMDVAEGLQEAHELGVIHRDVKPSNCFLEADGRVKVGDFGLAKSLVGGAHLTRTGAFLGTPLYVSPEQIRGEALTPQADVYSAAATLYFLLAGKAPFQSGDAAATLARIVSDDPPPMRKVRPEIPAALDAVVLRGLERNRDKRYKDLEEFRQVLRPFLPGRSAFVGLGIRFGAYLIDWLCMYVLTQMVLLPLVMRPSLWHATGRTFLGNPQMQLIVWSVALDIGIAFLYFLPEAFLGYSLGKRLLRLRVCGLLSTDRPGWRRGLLRTALFVFLPKSGHVAAVVIFLLYPFPPDFQSDPEVMARHLPILMLIGSLQILGVIGGYGLLCCTMRARNGLRGLHEFLSGTRVVQLPKKEKRLKVRGRALADQLTRPEELPQRTGPFAIKGGLRWGSKVRVMLGEDKGLGRDVVLWLRPAAEPALDSARRAISRITRLRWVSAGRQGDWQWDAFLAPSGCSLAELVQTVGPLPWPQARPLLEHLTGELIRACDERTVPWRLRPDQLWVQSNGRLVLLDTPLSEENITTGGSAVDGASPPMAAEEVQEVLTLEQQEQQMILRLLRQSAGLMLAGPAGVDGGLRTVLPRPLPEHAAEMLDRFSEGEKRYKDVSEFHQELVETRALPVEVTRPRRAAHLAVLAAFLFLGLGCCVSPVGLMPAAATMGIVEDLLFRAESLLEELDRTSSRDLLLASLSPSPIVRLSGLVVYSHDLDLKQRLQERLELERLRHLARINALPRNIGAQFEAQSKQRQTMRQAMKGKQKNPFDVSKQVREAVRGKLDVDEADKAYAYSHWACIIPVAGVPLLWMTWAFLTRGGFSFAVLALRLVGRDGRPAARWRCAWRILLVWGPFAALLSAALWYDGLYWSRWRPWGGEDWMYQLAFALFWTACVFLLLCIGFAIRKPSRSILDWLAGTYVVPR